MAMRSMMCGWCSSLRAITTHTHFQVCLHELMNQTEVPLVRVNVNELIAQWRVDNEEDRVEREDLEQHCGEVGDDGDGDGVDGTAGPTSADCGTAARADGDEDEADEEEVATDNEEHEEEEGDADEDMEGEESEEGSGDDSEEEVYTGDGEEAEDNNAEDYVDLKEEGGGQIRREDTAEDGVGTLSAHSNDTPPRVLTRVHMEGQHLNHWIIWLRKFHGGEVGPNDHFREGGYGVDNEVPDGGVKWVGADTWPVPPTEGAPARMGQQLIIQTYPKRFDKDHLQRALCEWVVATNQTFTMVEHPTVSPPPYHLTTPFLTPITLIQRFCNLMAAANPKCAVEKVIPSRNTLARQIIHLVGLARIKLMEMLAADGIGAFALTHDICTGENHRSYMSVTGHCLTKKFELRQITLDFRTMPGEHSGEKIVEVPLDVVKECNLEKRCIAETSDNASANVVAMEFLCRGGPTDHQPPLIFSGMHVGYLKLVYLSHTWWQLYATLSVLMSACGF
ncbi:unnamed protein product [Closterium sp. Yama58-4]|nr:unnamed protein product [Closterium sp. Yama58-4]